jgi:iron complex outermembrane recepter protein
MNEHRGRNGLKVAGAVALALAAASAGAQTAGTNLEEVIVTAQKRSQNVMNVPSAVSVVAQSQLENFHVTQLSDVAGYVPGLQVTSLGTPGQQFVSLRGIAPISPGANVGTYIDETPLGSSGIFQRETQFQVDLLPYDVERLEVLRGPQGTLYGAGAMGGLIKYVTRAPNLSKYEFQAGGGISDVEGSGDTGSIVRVGANLPLVEDRIALRASYALNEIPGYIDNVQTGDKDINDGEQESARLALLWQLTDDLSFELTGMTQSIDTDNNAIVALDPATERPLVSEFGNDLTVDEPFKKDIDYLSATVTWNFGDVELVSATGYSEVDTRQRQDATFALGGLPGILPPPIGPLPPGISYFDLALDFTKITQELRLSSTGEGGFQWQLGAFYTEEDAHNSQLISLKAVDGTPIPILDPVAELTLPTDYTEQALFANANYEFTDRFELGAGVRYASNDQDFWQIVTAGILIPIGTTTGKSDEDVFTWMIAPKWRLNEDTMIYGRVATGYQPGGPNVALPDVPPTVDSSQLTSYEVGLKSNLADDRVLLDAALFYIDWDDIQIVDSNDTTSWLVNGGKAESQGIEVSTLFKATDRLQLGLNVTYTDATVKGDVPALNGLSGDRLPYVPELAVAATADFFFPVGSAWEGRVGGGYRWQDDRLTELESDPAAIKLDSSGVLDLNADIGNDHWTFRAYTKNLTDERSYSTVDPALSGATAHLGAIPIQPRTYGLEVDFRF